VLNLVHAYPEGLNAKDKWGKTPRDCLKDGQNVDSDLVAVLERTPTYYAARIAEDKLMSTLNKEFMSKIDSITEKVKNEKNTTDLIITELREKVQNMEESLSESNAREQSLQNEVASKEQEVLQVRSDLEEERLERIAVENHMKEEMKQMEADLKESNEREQSLQNEVASKEQEVLRVFFHSQEEKTERIAIENHMKEEMKQMEADLKESNEREQVLQEENKVLTKANKDLAIQINNCKDVMIKLGQAIGNRVDSKLLEKKFKEERQLIEKDLKERITENQFHQQEMKALMLDFEIVENELRSYKQKVIKVQNILGREQSEKKKLEDRLETRVAELEVVKAVSLSMQEIMQERINSLVSQLDLYKKERFS